MGRVDGLISNLDLDGASAPSVRPVVGDWGPDHTPGAAQKRRARWWAVVAFLGLGIAVFSLGYWVYSMMAGA